MGKLRFWLLAGATFGTLGFAHALTNNDCAKRYNDCSNEIGNMFDKKSCKKKRAKCDLEVAALATAATQNSTKNRMLHGEAPAQNGMRPWQSGQQDSVEARKEAARKRIMDREQQNAQAPQKGSMRDNVNSN